jgi:hypothetical protein
MGGIVAQSVSTIGSSRGTSKGSQGKRTRGIAHLCAAMVNQWFPPATIARTNERRSAAGLKSVPGSFWRAYAQWF